MRTATVRVESGSIDRVRRGETPTLALELDDDERLMDVTLQPRFGGAERKTVDWTYSATIVRDKRGDYGDVYIRAVGAEFVLAMIAKGIPFRDESDPREAASKYLAGER